MKPTHPLFIFGMSAIALILSPSVPHAFAQADRGGKGGDAVVCTNPHTHQKTAYTLDFLEAERKLLHLDLKTPHRASKEQEVKEKIELVLKRIERLDPSRAKRYRENWELLNRSHVNIPKIATLIDIKDANLAWIKLKTGCQLVQTVIQIVNPGFMEAKFQIDADVFKLLNSDHQAGLYLHEIGYFDELNFVPNTPNSDQVRQLNAFFASSEADSISINDYHLALLQIFPNHARMDNLIPGLPLTRVKLTKNSSDPAQITLSALVGKIQEPYFIPVEGGNLAVIPGVPTMLNFSLNGKILGYRTEMSFTALFYEDANPQDFPDDYSQYHDFTPPPGSKISVYPLKTSQGTIWVQPGGGSTAINLYPNGVIQSALLDGGKAEFYLDPIGTVICHHFSFTSEGKVLTCDTTAKKGEVYSLNSEMVSASRIYYLSDLELKPNGQYQLKFALSAPPEQPLDFIHPNIPDQTLPCRLFVNSSHAIANYGGGGYQLVKQKKDADFVLTLTDVIGEIYSTTLTKVTSGYKVEENYDWETHNNDVAAAQDPNNIKLEWDLQHASNSSEFERIKSEIDHSKDRKPPTVLDFILQRIKSCKSML